MESERLHELFMELVRLVAAWHLEPNVSTSQAFAVHALDTEPPLSQQELAERLKLEKSSVSRLVADLERRELVVRQRDQYNGRIIRLRLTEAGRALHAGMANSFHGHYERWASAMTAKEQAALVTGLSAFLRAARHDAPR